MSIGQKIKEIRTKLGVTQLELAQGAKINLRTIQRIENEEVIPRSFTLKTIAKVLNIEESELIDVVYPRNGRGSGGGNKTKLVWLHASGLILLPTLLIWFFEKENEEVNSHGADVINFQLSMLAVLLPCLFLPGLPLLIALFTIIIVTINAIRVSNGKSYYYPLSIRILKS